jgi:hypothetical protein
MSFEAEFNSDLTVIVPVYQAGRSGRQKFRTAKIA